MPPPYTFMPKVAMRIDVEESAAQLLSALFEMIKLLLLTTVLLEKVPV
jgi:hypothetical protein